MKSLQVQLVAAGTTITWCGDTNTVCSDSLLVQLRNTTTFISTCHVHVSEEPEPRLSAAAAAVDTAGGTWRFCRVLLRLGAEVSGGPAPNLLSHRPTRSQTHRNEDLRPFWSRLCNNLLIPVGGELALLFGFLFKTKKRS